MYKCAADCVSRGSHWKERNLSAVPLLIDFLLIDFCSEASSGHELDVDVNDVDYVAICTNWLHQKICPKMCTITGIRDGVNDY